MGDELYKMLMDILNSLRYDVPSLLEKQGGAPLGAYTRVYTALSAAAQTVEIAINYIELEEKYADLQQTFENFPG